MARVTPLRHVRTKNTGEWTRARIIDVTIHEGREKSGIVKFKIGWTFSPRSSGQRFEKEIVRKRFTKIK